MEEGGVRAVCICVLFGGAGEVVRSRCVHAHVCLPALFGIYEAESRG